MIRGMDYHWVAARWFLFSERSAPTNRRDARRPSFAPFRSEQSNRWYIIELNIAWSRPVWGHANAIVYSSRIKEVICCLRMIYCAIRRKDDGRRTLFSVGILNDFQWDIIVDYFSGKLIPLRIRKLAES